MKNKKKVKVFDFFAGCGGTSLGFKQAGMDITFGLDFDKQASETFKKNFPEAYVINNDISKVDTNSIQHLINRECYTLFSGCAPCQPFSRQNNKKCNKDPRRNLLNEFSKFVEIYYPDIIFIENVPGIQKINNFSTPFFHFLEKLDSLGYKYAYDVLSALWFGVPQDRKRLILIASKHKEVSLPEISHNGIDIPYSTVRDWIGSLPPISNGEEHKYIKDHKSAKLNDLNFLRICNTPEGGNRENWPDHLKLKCHKNYKGHQDVYGRLSWDKPSSVLTTRCTSYSNGRFGHPEQNRAISLREAALLQTFPIDYDFIGNFSEKAKQIGNAVPPLMAKSIGAHILSILGLNNEA